jgi:catechol 2,3-dioxygenase-like lactoylglutathione lyase family enzyme
MITRAAHIGLTVSDLDRMLDFYTRILGLGVIARLPHPKGGTIVFLGAGDGELIEMIQYSVPKPPDGRDTLRTGLHHFGLYVDDIGKEVERLAALGVEFDGRIKVNTNAELAVHFWDPEGNRIHLTQQSNLPAPGPYE